MGKPDKESESYLNNIIGMVENKDFSTTLEECDKNNMGIDKIYTLYKIWLRNKKLNELLK